MLQVAEALAQAEIRLNTQLNDQKIKLEGEFSIRVDNMILEQQKIKEAALQQLQEKLEDHWFSSLKIA